MTKLSFKNNPKQAISALVLLAMLSFSIFMTGCGDSNVADVQNSVSGNSVAGVNNRTKNIDTTSIQLDMNIRFKSESISDSKYLESNLGNNFNHITSFSIEVKPGGVIDLQELQPYGIFGLYLGSSGLFTLYNADGMSFTSKTVLMEKCSFIDLKLRNVEQKTIKVNGLIAGE